MLFRSHASLRLCAVRGLRSIRVYLRRPSICLGALLRTKPWSRRRGSAVRLIRRVHFAHWIYPGGIEGRRQLDGIECHIVGNRSQRYVPDVPHNNSRCCGDIGDRLGGQQLPRRRQRRDACCDVDRRTKEVVRSAEYWAVVEPGPCQWNPRLGSASGKQTSEHLKGGCRVRKPKHRLVTYPLDRRPKPSECLSHQLLEASKYGYCRRISIDICYCAEARQIDKRDGRDRGLEAVDSTGVRTHS
jgi:hypothetical protein